jgi:hypothetical protein
VKLTQNCSGNQTEKQPLFCLPLWPDGAPGALGSTTNDIPTLTPYLPDPPTRPARRW